MKFNWLKIGSMFAAFVGFGLSILEDALLDKKIEEAVDEKFAEKSAENSEEEA